MLEELLTRNEYAYQLNGHFQFNIIIFEKDWDKVLQVLEMLKET